MVGTAFTGKDGGFFGYDIFGPDEQTGEPNPNDRALIFAGDRFVSTNDKLRLINLYSDSRQGIYVPFAAAATAPSALLIPTDSNAPPPQGLVVQPLYLLEDGDPTAENYAGHPVWLQTSFFKSGEGANQETMLVLALGEQDEFGQLTGERRGTSHILMSIDHHHDGGIETPAITVGETINLAGSIASLADGDGDFVMGNEVAHIVIGANSTGTGHKIFQDQPLHPALFAPPPSNNIQVAAFVDGPSTPPPSTFMGATYHFGEEIAAVDAVDLSHENAGTEFYGYAAGIYQQTTDNLYSDEEPIGMLVSSSPTDVHFVFKDQNQFSAAFNLQTDGGGGAFLRFGDWETATRRNPNAPREHGNSAFISDNIYAAKESGLPSIVSVDHYPYRVTANVSTYLVSADLLQTSGTTLLPGGKLCNVCDFMKWGAWGGQNSVQ